MPEEDRELTVTTPLGPDKLFFAGLSGTDEISQPFAFDLTMASEDVDIAVEDLLGKPVTVKVGRGDGIRFLSGLVDEVRFGEIRDRYVRYHATLRPALWFLSKSTDNRIFQNMSVVEIIEAVLGDYPDVTFEKRLEGTYDARDYCVQYGETDLDFLQRLMEHEGIWYFHEYGDGSHTLVLTDALAKLAPVPGFEEVAYRHDPRAAVRSGKFLTRWHRVAAVRPAAHVHTDYDFEKPAADLMAKSDAALGHPQDSGEQYHYPGNYIDLSRGDALAAIRRQEHQSPWQRVEAQGTAQGLSTGCTFKLIDFPRAAENAEYAVLATRYDLWDTKYGGPVGQEQPNYAVRLTLTPVSVDYRPPRRTPKPVMKGPQTAVVVGPSGEEIYTDKYSRVKVQFHWDRLGTSNEESSCWVRVSSVWAGAGWGFIQIPRIGQEVIVDFLEGDPDQPIITGRVYNAAQMPPYDLPGKATQSGWKSNSSLGGGGWNELRFEDKKGSEEVYFQAEKDHVELVKNDETRTIGHDWVEDVGNDATQNIGHDRTETVSNNKSTTVGKNRTVSIGVNDTEDVGSNRTLTVGADEKRHVVGTSTENIDMNNFQTIGVAQKVLVKGGRQKQIGLAELVTVGGLQSITVGKKRDIKVGSNQSHYVEAEDTYTVKGNQTVTIKKGQTITITENQQISTDGGRLIKVKKGQTHDVTEDVWIKAGKAMMLEAADSIVLKTGSASISMKKDGTINIEGKDITVTGSGKITVKASGETTIKGSKVNQN